MIELREDTGITQKEFLQTIRDTYHIYFPNSRIDVSELGGVIEIEPYLGNDTKHDVFQDDSNIEITLYKDNTKKASDNSPIGILLYVVVGGYNFSHHPCVQDFNAGWYEEIRDIDTDIDDNIDPETFIDWFDDFCSKLYKATRKMWRHGHISKEYEEFMT